MWTIAHGGQEIQVNGSVHVCIRKVMTHPCCYSTIKQDVLNYMTANFPDFKPGVTSNNDKNITSGDYNPLRPREMVSKKNNPSSFCLTDVNNALTDITKILPPLCVPVSGWNWQGAPDVPGAKGVMDGVPGNIKFVAGACGNLVCQFQTSLNICVDVRTLHRFIARLVLSVFPQSYQDVVASGPYIGHLAEGLIDQCTDENNLVGGQMFDTYKFNVIAYYDPTCGSG